MFEKKRVLFLGCHCDDIELGCGATISKISKTSEVRCVTFSMENPQGKNLSHIQQTALNILGVNDYFTYAYKTQSFQEVRDRIWASLSREVRDFEPDFVFCNESDTHQDHQTIALELRRIFGTYSRVFYSPSLHVSKPNFYVQLDQNQVDLKLKALEKYDVYAGKEYFDIDYLKASMKFHAYRLGDYCEAFRIDQLVM